MAQAVSLVNDDGPNAFQSIRKVEIGWTSDASGDVSLTLDTQNISDLKPINGELALVKFTPGTGLTQPSNNYTAKLLDDGSTSLDVFRGAAVGNRSNAVPQWLIPSLVGTSAVIDFLMPLAGTYTLVIDGAGNAKTGKVTLYLRVR